MWLIRIAIRIPIPTRRNLGSSEEVVGRSNASRMHVSQCGWSRSVNLARRRCRLQPARVDPVEMTRAVQRRDVLVLVSTPPCDQNCRWCGARSRRLHTGLERRRPRFPQTQHQKPYERRPRRSDALEPRPQRLKIEPSFLGDPQAKLPAAPRHHGYPDTRWLGLRQRIEELSRPHRPFA